MSGKPTLRKRIERAARLAKAWAAHSALPGVRKRANGLASSAFATLMASRVGSAMRFDSDGTSVFTYVWQHSRRQQLWVLGIIFLSMPTLFWSLDLPKQIVNGPIQGKGFTGPGATANYFAISLPLPEFLGGSVQLTSGVPLDRLSALIALSVAFLVLVVINNWFKQYINTYKGRLGEQMLRRLRYDLIDRVLRFPIWHFRRVRASEIATMVKDEVEPLGGFIGDAFVQPMFLGSQALTALFFIVTQNFWLGMIAVAIVVLQGYLIPRLRRALITLSRERQVTARQLAGRVGEIVDGIVAIRTNDTSNYERADISRRLGTIFGIRFELYQRKYFAKALNNFLTQVTPFLFYLIGGYYALQGHLDVGQLVAVIAAYKDLPSPIKDLIDWDQQRLDVQVKFTQVMEQFTVEGMVDPALQLPTPDAPAHIEGQIEIANASVLDDSGARLLEGASARLPVRGKIAFIGPVNSGAETLAEAIVRLVPVSGGRIAVGDTPIAELPDSVAGRRIAYVGADAYLGQSSLRDALLYGVKHHPASRSAVDAALLARIEAAAAEARAAGNSDLDAEADWVDYGTLEVEGPDEVSATIKRALRVVKLTEDVRELGLRGTIDPVREPALAARFLEARRELRGSLQGSKLSRYIEPFELERFNRQATIGENILFGTARGPIFAGRALASHPVMRSVLAATGLAEPLMTVGRSLASTAIELFAGLTPDNPLLEQLSFMTPEQIPEYQALLSRLPASGTASPRDRDMLIALAFNYIERRHRLGLVDEALEAKVVEARAAFRSQLPEALRASVAFYDPEAYNPAASLQDNVLFGRIVYGLADAPQQVRLALDELLERLQLRTAVQDVGLAFDIGHAGKRLSVVQRQKVAVARALLKRPDILIVNRALAALDGSSQAAVLEAMLASLEEGKADQRLGLIWVTSVPDHIDRFDLALVFRNGQIVEQGAPSDLKARYGTLARLAA